MKKTIPAAILLSMALMLTSCSAGKDGDNTPERVSGGQTKVSSTENAATAASGESKADPAFSLTYNGVKIRLDDEVAPVVKSLGKDYVYTQNPSCAYVGVDITYDYKALILYCQEKNGKEIINTVEVRNDTVDCGGIKIGQTLDDVKKIYGDPASSEEYGIVYEKDGLELQFITDNSGKIVFILYTHVRTE